MTVVDSRMDKETMAGRKLKGGDILTYLLHVEIDQLLGHIIFFKKCFLD